MARRAPIQVNDEQWATIQGKYGFSGVTKEQFNTSLRDRRRVTRISKTLEKAIDDSGISLNAYRRVVRSIREFRLIKEKATTFWQASTGQEAAKRKATKNIQIFERGLKRMQEYDSEYVYVYKNGTSNYFQFDLDKHQVTITYSGGKTATYDISSSKGLGMVLGMAQTAEIRKVTEEVGDIFAESAEDEYE